MPTILVALIAAPSTVEAKRGVDVDDVAIEGPARVEEEGARGGDRFELGKAGSRASPPSLAGT